MAKQLLQCCGAGTSKHNYGPAFGDCLQGRSAMGPTGASHRVELATKTYVAEIFFVQSGLTSSLCLSACV